MRRHRSSLGFGCLCAALAASILAVRAPYYAVAASAALVVVLITWVVVLSKAGRNG
jgi:hypothetical protein